MTRAVHIAALGTLVLLAGCSSPPLQVGLSAQRAAVPKAALVATSTAAAGCPETPVGCFASPPSCRVRICFCPRVCAPAKRIGTVWLRDPAECSCAMG